MAMAMATARAMLLIRNKRYSEAVRTKQINRLDTSSRGAADTRPSACCPASAMKGVLMKGISSEWKCLIGVILVSAIILIYLGLAHPSAYAGPDTIDGARAMISTAIMMIACTGIFWHRNKD